MLVVASCGGGEDGESIADESAAGVTRARVDQRGEVVRPPFAVRGECEGLMLVWFDAEGAHPAAKRSDVPEANRARVRVDSLRLAPHERLDPAYVYVADLRRPKTGDAYEVRK